LDAISVLPMVEEEEEEGGEYVLYNDKSSAGSLGLAGLERLERVQTGKETIAAPAVLFLTHF